MNISKTKFMNNIAVNEGGALKWTFIRPLIDDSSNIFKNNKAFYGNDLASFPIRMQILFFSKKS